MRFVVDECSDVRLHEYLASLGHDSEFFGFLGPGTPDESVLAYSVRTNRVLITADKDFGELIFRDKHPHCGVIFLRPSTMSVAGKLASLLLALEVYGEHLADRFIVTDEESHRANPPLDE